MLTKYVKVGVVVFPGSNCDRDVFHVLSDVFKLDTEYYWHEKHLPENEKKSEKEFVSPRKRKSKIVLKKFLSSFVASTQFPLKANDSCKNDVLDHQLEKAKYYCKAVGQSFPQAAAI